LGGIAGSVHAALSAVNTAPDVDRRRQRRNPYPYPLYLTPLNGDGQPNVEESFVVFGKHLSPHGVDFYCHRPVSEQRVIASLDCGAEGFVGLVLQLTWCRFGRHGWYDNGGRFVGVVPSPILELDGQSWVA
jgi:hypothetical protein